MNGRPSAMAGFTGHIWPLAMSADRRPGKRVEQQAFAKHGLDFVSKKYLPAKLKARSKFLP